MFSKGLLDVLQLAGTTTLEHIKLKTAKLQNHACVTAPYDHRGRWCRGMRVCGAEECVSAVQRNVCLWYRGMCVCGAEECVSVVQRNVSAVQRNVCTLLEGLHSRVMQP